jgi:predicted transcriptional regulator
MMHPRCNIDDLAKQLSRTTGYVATRLSMLARAGHVVARKARVEYQVTPAGIVALAEDIECRESGGN